MNSYYHQPYEVRYTYRFNDGMLYLDDGIAYDSPGYYFKKLVN